MRSFKAQSQFNPSATQPEMYSPSQTNYQNKVMNTTQNSVNKKRNQQIVLLHEQFEDLKRKIKYVQNKNQKIIEKIHRDCNFKKKTPQTFDLSAQGPIVYYEKKQKSQVSQKSRMSVDESNKSDQSQYEFRQKKSTLDQRNSAQSNKHITPKNFSQSMQYTRVDMNNNDLKKKFSKISHHNNVGYEEEQPDSRELLEDEFAEGSTDQFQIQGSHQTYHHLKDYGNGNGNSGKSSGKKSAVISSYPASQTHMGYSLFNQSAQSQMIQQPPSLSSQLQEHNLRPSHPNIFSPSLPAHYDPSRLSIQSTTTNNSSLVIYQLQESLKIQKEKTAYLQQELKVKQIQIMGVKKEYNKLLSQFQNVEMILEDNLEQFFQNVVKKGFFDIDKQLKKYENRLRNLAINVKDDYEELKSSKLIKEHQLRRSNSRSKKDLSPHHNTSIHSVITPPNSQSAKIPRPGSCQGSSFNQNNQPQPQNLLPSQTSLFHTKQQKSSRISEQSKKNKQFEEIVQKYEEMIKSKSQEITKLEDLKGSLEKRNEFLEKQLETKEVEAKEFKQRLEELDKLMSEMASEGPIQGKSNNLQVNKRQYRVSSTQSNLLEDIEQQNDQSSSQSKFQHLYQQARQQIEQKDSKIAQLEQQLELYESKITQYQQKIQQSQQKIKKLQSVNSSQSIKVSQKSTATIDKLSRQQLQDSIKKHLGELHQLEINHKDAQIMKCKESIVKLEKRIVEKDCEHISLQNKVKKLEGVNQLSLRKVEEYQKLLNQYQHNASVDMGESGLDRSLCQDFNFNEPLSSSRSNTGAVLEQLSAKKNNQSKSKNNITISKSQFQSLQNQLREMSEQILTLTKKLKLTEKANNQKASQIQRLVEDIDSKISQRLRFVQQNNDLRSKVIELQEELNQMKSESDNEDRSEEYDDPQEGEQLQKVSTEQKDDRKSLGYRSPGAQESMQESKLRKRRQKRRQRLSNVQPLSMSINNRSTIVLDQSRKQSITSQFQSLLQTNTHLQQSITRLQQQLSTTKSRTLEISAQYNHLKSDHLELSRVNISLKKNNEYLEESLADREQKYEKCKKEFEELKVRNSEMVEELMVKEEEIKKEKMENCQKIQELEKHFHEFEEQINQNNNENLYNSTTTPIHDTSQLMRASRYNISESSLLLSSTIHNKNSQYLQEQNEYLTIKLKEAEATIEMHNLMEEKVLNEYKANVDKLKSEVREKGKECEGLRKELDVVNDAKRRLEVLYQSSKNYLNESRVSHNNPNPTIRKRLASESSSKKPQSEFSHHSSKDRQPSDLAMQEFPSYNEDNNNLSMMSSESPEHQFIANDIPNLEEENEEERLYPYERILELEGELKEAKDINKKLEEMEEELFKQIRLKEEEKKDLMRLIDEKNLKIQELEEIVELKDNNNPNISSSHLGSNILGSHISSSNYKSSGQNKHNLSQRQSLHSHSSLRYSGITHLKNPTLLLNNNNASSNNLQVMGESQFGTSQRFEIELSETGSEMLDKSYVTNISEIFEKEEFPYEKVQLKRKEQIKLFEKTASYIKSLKESINEKNKRIKLLEKKIESLKNTHHGPISKELQNKYEISTRANENAEDPDIEVQTVFKDYQSVQLERKKASHNKRYKNLEHEWKLAIEENNVLSNQVEVLQEELEKAEEQENTILVMKDLYKDEIKKLLAKNEQQTAYYEDLLSKQKRKVEESQSVHNLQTIKQLFLKVMDSIIVMESEKSKKKRQEKKKDLEQFFKIFASLCAVEEPKKNAIIEGIKKMTLNIVLAEDGRGSSKGKQ